MVDAESIDLSIVIVNWNTRELLAKCLESVFNTVQEHSVQVVVVDNASSDGSIEMVSSRFPQVKLIVNAENTGFARANNQAIHSSQGRYILLLNSDTVVLPRALDTMVHFMDDNARVGAIGPRLLSSDGQMQLSCGPIPKLGMMLADLTGFSRLTASRFNPAWDDTTYAHRVGWIQGAALLIRRETIGDVGLLDEDYFMYTEEVDWCYRAGIVGWGLYYLPAAEIIHYGGMSAAREPATRRSQLYSSKLLFIRKHYGWPAFALAKLATKGSALLKLSMAAIRLPMTNGEARQASQDSIQSYATVLKNV